ncbi:MAG: AAA family ATPase [Alphaproteobacteria bacterium]|nr:MAG: AAA family ATPase [Alphaproteobacteria bacterium]
MTSIRPTNQEPGAKMRISKFNRIKARTFHDFSWPSELPEFADYNLIYGWNGSGKTTLADILRMVEKRQSIGEEGIDGFAITYDDRIISNTNLATDTAPPSVRVFNRAFIEKNVFAANGATPIFFIGEENIEKQRELERKKEALSTLKADAEIKKREKDNKEKELDNFCTNKATGMRGWLNISSTQSYNKSNFRKECDELISVGQANRSIKTDKELSELRATIALPAKEKISPVSLELPDLNALTAEIKTLLQTTVVSQAIASLANDSVTSAWVKEGLQLHKDHKSEKCKFCEQVIPAARLAALEGHFNDEFKALDSALTSKSAAIEQIANTLGALQLPAPEKFYEDLKTEYNVACQKLNEWKGACVTFLGQLTEALGNKKGSLFMACTFDISPTDDGAAQLKDVNAVIAKHNNKTRNFSQEIMAAKEAIKSALVAGAITEYQTLKDALDVMEKEHKAQTDKIKVDSTAINELEQGIINHKKPAEDINTDLKDYLGHSEIRFATSDGETGYAIMRGDKPAAALSEGERTAIALLHFLKTLEDQKFKLSEGIVVIDDPVCSMDDASMFSAFGYIKNRTKDAKQLFILTHNFKFFQCVKDWFRYAEKHKKEVGFYKIDASIENGIRISKINELDNLLKEYNSEYHYLFKQTYIMSHADNSVGNLETNYHMPNIARRLLENFLAFRMPDINDLKWNALYSRIKSSGFDTRKKSIIERFLNLYSHKSQIGYDEHDSSILAETPQIMRLVLELIKHEDRNHYDRMVALVDPPASKTSTKHNKEERAA